MNGRQQHSRNGATTALKSQSAQPAVPSHVAFIAPINLMYQMIESRSFMYNLRIAKSYSVNFVPLLPSPWPREECRAFADLALFNFLWDVACSFTIISSNLTCRRKCLWYSSRFVSRLFFWLATLLVKNYGQLSSHRHPWACSDCHDSR